MAEFKDTLRYLRLRDNLSQKELAAKIDVTAAAVSNYEKGLRAPDNQTLTKIAEVFGISLDELMGREIGVVTRRADFDIIKNPQNYEPDSHDDVMIENAIHDYSAFLRDLIFTTQQYKDTEQFKRLLSYANYLNTERILREGSDDK